MLVGPREGDLELTDWILVQLDQGGCSQGDGQTLGYSTSKHFCRLQPRFVFRAPSPLSTERARITAATPASERHLSSSTSSSAQL